MARQQRTTTFAQESTRPITQVALYARVSTLNNQDPEMQLSELREYAGRRGWQIVEEFTDQGVAGCNESRPALNRLMSDACRRSNVRERICEESMKGAKTATGSGLLTEASQTQPSLVLRRECWDQRLSRE
jgi:hypothetical protein